MELITNYFKENLYTSNIFNTYFKDLKIGVFDIETTGLYPNRNSLILGGLLVSSPDGIETKQYFADEKKEEKYILETYTKDLSNLDLLISYNGNNFDLPFIKRRCEKHKIDFELSHSQSLDLYWAINKYSNLRKILPNLKQKTVENFIGLWSDRTDEISGKESVDLYNEYLCNKDQNIKNKILLHNKDDLLQLSRLLQITKKLDFHKIMFHNGFIVTYEDKKIYVDKIELFKNSIKVCGTHKNINMDYKCFKNNYYSYFSNENKRFNLNISAIFEYNHIFVDLEEININYDVLKNYGGFQSNYLLIKDTEIIYYTEINCLVKLILEEIIKSF
ncbi:ribonuclease H-like domain-containing protein [Anaerovorax odorimutans]|uniref:ribonuclease H-like domain-containing protein n=1 Tax=Anaerovorax odorimutans TaxID=109327 RepID=UPI00041ABDEA|nr:ribonuclease H-like domain-containing protein [Anaerovorax odorimutans]